MPKSNTDSNKFFNNTGLQDISQYSNNKYTSVPNDASLTNFYKLGIDSNFNITPQLTPEIIPQTTAFVQPSAISFA